MWSWPGLFGLRMAIQEMDFTKEPRWRLSSTQSSNCCGKKIYWIAKVFVLVSFLFLSLKPLCHFIMFIHLFVKTVTFYRAVSPLVGTRIQLPWLNFESGRGLCVICHIYICKQLHSSVWWEEHQTHFSSFLASQSCFFAGYSLEPVKYLCFPKHTPLPLSSMTLLIQLQLLELPFSFFLPYQPLANISVNGELVFPKMSWLSRFFG